MGTLWSSFSLQSWSECQHSYDFETLYQIHSARKRKASLSSRWKHRFATLPATWWQIISRFLFSLSFFILMGYFLQFVKKFIASLFSEEILDENSEQFTQYQESEQLWLTHTYCQLPSHLIRTYKCLFSMIKYPVRILGGMSIGRILF